jgi:predicted nucleotidyltransferase
MLAHHQRALDKACHRLLESADVLAILLGGSIAKKCERPDSDVDLIVVITDDGYRARRAQHQVAFLWKDVVDYPDGYVEGRFVPRSFIIEAVERGSEPTRHSFTGVYPIHCTDPEIAQAVPRIPVYPVHRQQQRMQSFFAQMMLNKWYFWSVGARGNDAYLKHRAASDIVLFGARLILAHNQKLFPCQRRLMEALAACEKKPADIVAKANRVLLELTDEARDSFCDAVIDFVGWPKADLLSLFLEDVETAWYTRTPAVAEW